ncbi:MAG TPA: complex I NDUFA9 subunit family protein [Burkholderiales bacterium]|nr:complex I NDUFA9 subunit family protein [Burkholderiales bacterium]
MANVCVIGGSGFIGRHLCERLVQDGHCVLIPTRRRERAKHLLPLPTADVIEADVHQPATLRRLFAGVDVVINLVGVLHSRRGQPYGPEFARAHVELPQKIIAACRETGVRRLIHISALKCAPDAPSAYLRSKADGEDAVVQARGALNTTIFRPSVVFGSEDRFLNTFASLQAILPVMVLACPQAKFQPVYVCDVATAIAKSIDCEESHGRAYDLVGPNVYTLHELVEYAGRMSGHHRPILELDDRMSYVQARLLELMPGKLMTADQYYSMRVDSTSTAPLPFGLAPHALETIAPVYLSGKFPRSRYSFFRYYAGRKGREV